LEEDVNDEKLREIFAEFGPIASVVVMKNSQGASKGFGFVCFVNEADAEKALVGMRTKPTGKKPLFVARAQRREERRIQLENEFQTSMVQRMQYSQLFYPPTAVPMPQPGMFYPPMYRRFPPAGMPMQMRGGFQGPFIPQAKRGRGGYYAQTRGGSSNNGAVLQSRTNARPRTQPSRNHQPPATAAPIVPGTQQTRDLASILASENSIEKQKNILGERLFPLVQKEHAHLAGKITGMLLEMDVGEILSLIESPTERQAKINEALEVLNTTGSK